MSREDFEGIKLHAKAVHDERVAKNPDRATKELVKKGLPKLIEKFGGNGQ